MPREGMTDQEFVQQYADEDRLNELPPGEYMVTEIHVPGPR